MKKNLILALAAAVAVMFGNTSRANTPATLTDLAGSDPVPGTYDIALLTQAHNGQPPGLNYYFNNGAPPGQTFLTPSGNPGGYVLNNLSVLAAGSGGGGVTSAQAYHLRIYSYNPANSNATLLATYQSQSTFTFYEGDWLQWSGLNVGLQANSYYAFSFERASLGWELMGSESTDLYPDGAACLIPIDGGQIPHANFSTTAGYDANMDIGLSLAVFGVNDPTIAPGTVVSTGQVTTVTSGTVLNAAAYTYQWQTDGGGGGALTNMPGATSSSVTANTAQVGVYQFDVVVSNTSPSQVITSAVASLTVTYPIAAATLTDMGSSIVPGAFDINQLSGGGAGDNLNYYDNNNDMPGQSFTTSNNPAGYTLTSLAVQTGGHGTGTDYNLITVAQPYYLFIYSVDATRSNATLIQEFTNASFSFSVFGDWLQWSGLSLQLQPNHTYAYAFENYAGYINGGAYTYGWALMNQSTNSTYTGGELCLIEPQGGSLYFGNSHASNPPCSAVFNAGLTANGMVIHYPQVTPITGSPLGGVLAGTPVTLVESATGDPTLHYTWQTDNGTGGAFTSIPGNDTSNLVLNTTGSALGVYKYQVIVHNAYSPDATTPPVDVTIIYANTTGNLTDIGASAPTPGANDIYQFTVPAGSGKPDGLNYYFDNVSAPPGQTFTTGANSLGYVLKSVAIKLAGDSGTSLDTNTPQQFMLRIYTVSAGGTATPYAYVGSQVDFVFNTLVEANTDWLQWTGLSLPLAPNKVYAYSFSRLVSGFGYCNLANVPGDLLAGGQVCLIPPYGGAIQYGSSGASDGTFDLGISLAVKIDIQSIGGGQLQLTWPSGILLQATSLNGPWTTNSATSPYTLTPTGAQKFYRVQLP
jgi:hypothetical protein